MKNYTVFLISTIILICVNLIQTDELLELDCSNDTQCRIFEYFGLNSKCLEDQCHCTNDNGETVKCEASVKERLVYNIIGAPCPCKQLNAECNEDEDVCYCKRGYMSSKDRRRCIPKVVSVGGKCEMDSQCQLSDINSSCSKSKICECLDQYNIEEGKCGSVTDNETVCSSDSECYEKYGANTKCNNVTHHCFCTTDYVASINKTHCLKKSEYQEECVEDIQCMVTLGAGGRCVEKICQCSKDYSVEKTNSKNDTMEITCQSIHILGRYCRSSKDCYQPQLGAKEQSMECFYAECVCKIGFTSYNDTLCIKDSGVGIKSLMGLNILLSLFVFVNKYVFLN